MMSRFCLIFALKTKPTRQLYFCANSCIMFRFRGFKASLNFTSGKQTGLDHYGKSPGVSLTGAYRTNKDELFGNFKYQDPAKTHQTISPSMVKLPKSQARASAPAVNPSRSTNDISVATQSGNVRNSTPNVAQANNTELTKAQIKEQKKLEKTRLAEQKKRDKLLAKEQQKEEKLKKEREKQMQRQDRNKNTQKTSKKRTPQPKQTAPSANPVSRIPAPPPAPPVPYSTNTLESSISRTTGPPPYEVVPNESDNTGNTSFAKPDTDTSSWDLISQHRQEISRPVVSKSIPKQTHMDLNYNVRISKINNDNSEA